jgi:hypothetical protein
MFDIANPAEPSPFYNRLSKSVRSTIHLKEMIDDFFTDTPTLQERDDFIAQVVWNQDPRFVQGLFDHFKGIDIQFQTPHYGETTILLYALSYQKYDFALHLCRWALDTAVQTRRLNPIGRIFIVDAHPEYSDRVKAAVQVLQLSDAPQARNLCAAIIKIRAAVGRAMALQPQSINPTSSSASKPPDSVLSSQANPPTATADAMTLTSDESFDLATALGSPEPFAIIFPTFKTMTSTKLFETIMQDTTLEKRNAAVKRPKLTPKTS